MIAASGNKDLAYFSEIKSNAQGCRKPTDQKFKCVTIKEVKDHVLINLEIILSNAILILGKLC